MISLEKLANLGELIGGIAVVASLIYLAIQIRQNTANIRSTTIATNAEIWTSMLSQIAHLDFNGAYLSVSSGKPELKPRHLLRVFLIY